MTAVLETTKERPTTDDTVRYASWPARAGAFLLDFVPGVAVIATMTLLAIAAPLRSLVWWVFVAVVVVVALAMLVNRVVLPTVTGWTMGRAVFGSGSSGVTANLRGAISCSSGIWPTFWTPLRC